MNLIPITTEPVFRPSAIVFDIDGTLADVTPYLHHIVGTDDPDHDAFNRDCVDARVNEELIADLRAMQVAHHIFIITARAEQYRAHTSYWLSRYGIGHDALFMRANDDPRPYPESKRDAMKQILQFWDVVLAYDDDPNILEIWDEMSIPRIKIGDWDGKN